MRKLWTSRVISTNVIVFGVAFLATMLISSTLAPATSSNAAETKLTATVTYATHSIALTPSDSTVLLDINARPTGAMSVARTTINTNTTSPNGYKLYLSMNSDTSDLVQQGSTNTISSSTGTLASPAKMLSNSVWGYAVPNVSTSTVVKPNGFDASYTTGLDIAPTENKFAGIPNSEQPAQLIAEKSSASASSGDDLDIIYAVRAGYDTPVGTYSNKVVYTAVADGGAGHNMVISPSQTSNTAGGDKIKLITTFYGTMQDVTANAYLLTDEELANVKNKTNPISDYAAKQLSCTRDTSASTLELECTTPAASIGNYNIYLSIPDYSDSYEKAFNYVEATFWNISAMQQMTPALCASVTTPAASATRTDTTGSHNNDTSYVPQRTLYDIRDYETYIIRKLADGNCWMTENLRLELSANQVLTSATSDVTADRTVDLATQPYNHQPSTNRYNWGVAAITDFSKDTVDRWLSRSTKKDGVWTTETTPVQNVSADRKKNLTGEDQRTGVYYNWYAATAGTGSYDITAGDVTATDSVCPAGWQLPRYSAVNGTSTTAPNKSWMYLIRDTYKIITTQGDQGSSSTANAKLHAFPFSLPYSGAVRWQSGGTESQGASGYFWSAGSTSQTDARSLGFGGTYVWPEGSYYRLYGFSVRCVNK